MINIDFVTDIDRNSVWLYDGQIKWQVKIHFAPVKAPKAIPPLTTIRQSSLNNIPYGYDDEGNAI